MRSPQGQRLMRDVAQYEPGFDLTTWKHRNDTANDFSKGKMADNVRSLKTTIGHYDTLLDKVDGLHNTSFPLINAGANAFNENIYDPNGVVKGFDTARNAVANELMKVFRNTGGSVTEVKDWERTLDAASTPAQFNEAISTGLHLLRSRLDAVGEQYAQGMGKLKNGFDPMELLGPENAARLARIEQRLGGRAPAAPAAGGPAKVNGYTIRRID
jgi:hypothetical protein